MLPARITSHDRFSVVDTKIQNYFQRHLVGDLYYGRLILTKYVRC